MPTEIQYTSRVYSKYDMAQTDLNVFQRLNNDLDNMVLSK